MELPELLTMSNDEYETFHHAWHYISGRQNQHPAQKAEMALEL